MPRSNTRDLAWQAGALLAVPFWVMWGVQGIETDFGRNITTSSAGARGLYQFIESTAHEWHYPYTNDRRPSVLTAQARVAAEYLSSLRASLGSWDAALRSYSGHGYGAAEVRAKSHDPTGGYAFAYSGLEAILGGAGPGSHAPEPTARGVTGAVHAGVVPAHPAGSYDYHAKVQHTGEASGKHGSTIQRVNAALSGIPARYRR